jgi:hypothetical protein
MSELQITLYGGGRETSGNSLLIYVAEMAKNEATG